MVLDYKFYNDYYLSDGVYSDEYILEHWNAQGKTSGFFQNPDIALEFLLQDSGLPNNFDVFTYMDINRDVADASRWPFEAILHYLNFGLGEGRQYRYDIIPNELKEKPAEMEVAAIPAEDLKEVVNPSFRLLTDEERDSWVAVGLDRFSNLSIDDFLESHPRRAATLGSFNLASYIVNNPDIAEAAQGNPLLSALHYLDFGLEEGRNARPEWLDPAFIWSFYNVKVSQADTLEAILSKLREKSHGADELYFFNETEWAKYHGIDTFYFLPYFDHEYYRCFMPGDGSLKADRWTCLRHFWSTGRFVPSDISYEMRFDPEHYLSGRQEAASTQPHAGSAAVVEVFNEWLREGINRNESPNMLAWLRASVDMSPPENFDAVLREYARCAGLASETQINVAAHMLNSGSTAILKLSRYDTSVGLLLAKIADRYSMSGNERLADCIYKSIVSAYPELTSALQHQSDQLDRAGFKGSATALREIEVNRGVQNIWTYLTLSEGYEALGRPDEAASILRKACKIFPGDIHLRERRRARARQSFEGLWGSAPSLALEEGYSRTQAVIADALREYTEERVLPVTRSADIKRVAIVANYDIAQCKLYRVNQKLLQLKAAGFEAKSYNYSTEIEDFVKALGSFDAVIFFRVPAFPRVIDAITLANNFGLPTYYDIDDLIFDGDNFPPALSTYAGTISSREHAEIACGVPMFAFAMSLCKFGIVSTNALVPLVAQHVQSGEVFVHRNALGIEHTDAIAQVSAKPRSDGKFRVFYGSGTKAHKEDFYSILEPALVRLVETHGDRVEIYLMGYFEWSKPLLAIRNNITIMQPVWDVDLYWGIVSQMDVNLAVLAPSLANDCKSEIKWLEAAMFGIPSVVSATQVFLDVVRHGETGFICNSTDDFFEALDQLLKDPSLRLRIGNAARETVVKSYSVEALSRNLTHILHAGQAQKKARLLAVNVFYPPQAIGGATRVVHNNVLDLLEKYGDEFDIDVICTLEGGTQPYSVETYSLEGVRVFAITAPLSPDIDRVALNEKMAEAFGSCLDVVEPDLIHFHCVQRLTAATVNLAHERKIPYVITVHDGWWISDYQFMVDSTDLPQLYQYQSPIDLLRDGRTEMNERAQQLRRPLANAQRILSISDAFTRIYREAGVQNVITVKNGLPALRPVAKKPSPRGKVRIAHIGGVERHKGFHLVKYALMSSDFSNLELIVVDATLEAGVSRSETWGGTIVRYRGRSRQDQVSELYAEIDVLLAPSVWPEGFGLVAREALACGCWVVASDRGAVGDDVVPGQNGFVIDVETVGPIKAVLEAINADPETYMRSPEYKSTLRSSTDQAEELVKIYREILTTHIPL